jgi:protein-arginine kinase activator protein McsA
MENWKATITVYSKKNKHTFKKEKQTTKQCHKCGNEYLLLFATLNLKSCPDCYTDIPWYLEDEQKPLI